MNSNFLLYNSLVFFIFFNACIAQTKESIVKYEEQKNYKTYLILDLNSTPASQISNLLDKKGGYAVRFSSNNEINASFIKAYKKNHDSLITITKYKIDDSLSNDLHIDYKEPINSKIIRVRANKNLSADISIAFKGKDSIIEHNVEVTDSLFTNIWMKFGSKPAFVEADKELLLKTDSIISKINSLRYVYGTIKTEQGELVNDVKFKGYSQSVVNGHFSFPIIDVARRRRFPILIPYKAGYHFSPDIIYTTALNLENNKNFKALRLDINFELSDHFIFDPGFENKVKHYDEKILLNNVEIKKDSVRGKVGYFNNRSYIDTGIESKNSLQKSFTISAWIKPVALGANNSILGKGDNFVVKLHDGFLTFTMAGIKDYISKTSPIPINTWTHIVLVHSEIDNSLFFYVNGEQTEEVKLIADYVTSDYSIVIGSNLWEEFFEGYLSDIKIWERELNSKEVASLFLEQKESSSRSIVAIILGALLLGILAFLLKRSLKRKNQNTRKQNKQLREKIISNAHNIDDKECVLCFGRLKILDENQQDIAEKLSPLLKKLFVIVFLYSHQGNKKGISTKQLTEFLWPGMSLQKAKNTRGTNINNLRTILNSCTGVNLVFKNKFWFIELSENCYCDYLIIQEFLNKFSRNRFSIKELEETLPTFLKILKEGHLFSRSSEPWLDPFIEKFSNQIIEQCLSFNEILTIEKHSDLMFLLTEVICIYDDLNEKAHKLKLQILIKQGKLSLAYKTYDNFVKLYYKIYKEVYAISFEEMTSK